MSTFNKTYMSYFLGVFMAEYIINIVPKGTHDWNKFIEPSNLIEKCEQNGFDLIHLQGAEYDYFRNEMKFSMKNDVNYMVSFRKK